MLHNKGRTSIGTTTTTVDWSAQSFYRKATHLFTHEAPARPVRPIIKLPSSHSLFGTLVFSHTRVVLIFRSAKILARTTAEWLTEKLWWQSVCCAACESVGRWRKLCCWKFGWGGAPPPHSTRAYVLFTWCRGNDESFTRPRFTAWCVCARRRQSEHIYKICCFFVSSFFFLQLFYVTPRYSVHDIDGVDM